MTKLYQDKRKDEQGNEVQDALEVCVQKGAKKMLAATLEEEVTNFLERLRYQRSSQFRGYRNGHHPPREITVGLGTIEVRVTRVVAKVPPKVAPQEFQSQIIKRYEQASEATRRLFARLYLERLATGDFEPVFWELVGETTALSSNAIVRLKEYEAWRKRPLWGHRYAYTWEDGVYLGAGPEKEKTALLCIVGVCEDGEKELRGMEPGYRESKESWAEMLRDLRNRGLEAPLTATGDGALGLWAALNEVYPTTEHKRCWNYRITNVQAKLPKRYQTEARRRLREMYETPTQEECNVLYLVFKIVERLSQNWRALNPQWRR